MSWAMWSKVKEQEGGVEARKKKAFLAVAIQSLEDEEGPDLRLGEMSSLAEDDSVSLKQFQAGIQLRMKTEYRKLWEKDKENDFFDAERSVWRGVKKVDSKTWEHASEFWLRSPKVNQRVPRIPKETFKTGSRK